MPDDVQEPGETPDEGTEEQKPDPTAGLKSALQKERDARKAESKARKELENRLAELEQERTAEKIGVTSERLAEIRAAAEAKFKADLEERDRLRVEVRGLKLDGTVKSMLVKSDVVDPDAAWKLFRDQFDLTDDGKPIVTADPTTDIEQYIGGTLRQQYPYMFRGTQADGGSARGNRGTNTATRTIQSGDTKAFLANLDKIVAGEVEVR